MLKKIQLAGYIASALLLPALGYGQTMNINVGDDLFAPERLVQMFLLITLLSLAPSILMMVTSFVRIIIVFSFLRTALGLQTTPPNSVLVALALFLTMFIMQPVFQQAWERGVIPYMNEQVEARQAWTASVAPFHEFMRENVREQDLQLFLQLNNTPTVTSPEALPLAALVPAFMISELKRAFEIGFLIFLPFLVIDLAVASILMAMGMMMLPPVIISLPFKIIFFVLIDGWHLLAGALVESFNR